MIYFDNGATSYPKPLSILKCSYESMRLFSFNSGRGGYRESVKTSEKIYDSREKIGGFFGFEPQNIAFTNNCTTAVNYAVKGTVNKGDHVIISNLEHNAVARPVHKLSSDNIIDYTMAEYDPDPDIMLKNFEKNITGATTAIICTGASNVFGVLLPYREIGELAEKYGVTFILDGAQVAGIKEINDKKDHIDILCCPGHKGLYGPMGTGFIAIDGKASLQTLVEGGTGSSSLQLEQPDFMPDMLESGTLNNSGIIALAKGIDFVQYHGIANIHRKEMGLISFLYDELSKMEEVQLYVRKEQIGVPILSFNYGDYSSEKTASLLAEKGIAVRAGLHCAPLAHRAFGTEQRGTVRISLGIFNTYRDCEIFINTLKKL